MNKEFDAAEAIARINNFVRYEYYEPTQKKPFINIVKKEMEAYRKKILARTVLEYMEGKIKLENKYCVQKQKRPRYPRSKTSTLNKT